MIFSIFFSALISPASKNFLQLKILVVTSSKLKISRIIDRIMHKLHIAMTTPRLPTRASDVFTQYNLTTFHVGIIVSLCQKCAISIANLSISNLYAKGENTLYKHAMTL